MSNRSTVDSRPNISEELANTLRDMISDGELASGERINEVQLSTRLGISRTPLREALTMLVAEQAIDSIPRRGFFVRGLSREEFENIHPIRALLDPEALRLSGIPSESGLRKLEQINQKIAAEKDMRNRVSLDDKWHLELISNCQNPVLIDLVRLFMRRFRRYGLAFFREKNFVATVNQEHNEIIAALKREDLDQACDWLRRNLSSDQQPILDWLDERDTRNA
jgi:DNA-binding GntR family transcriptional regulator